MPPAHSESFTSSLLIWMPLTSFSFLIAVVKASKTMLGEVVRVGIFVLFQILDFSPPRMLTVNLSYSLYYAEVCSLYTHLVAKLFKNHKQMLHFFQYSFCSSEMIIWFLSLVVLMWYIPHWLICGYKTILISLE